MQLIALFVIFVLLTGVMMMSIPSDAFAGKGGNDKQEAKGCQNANNDKMKNKNKHCESNGNGNGNGLDPLPANTCDGGDGAISLAEIPVALGFTQSDIDDIEAAALSNSNNNGSIDTLGEWNIFQLLEPGACL